MIENREKGNQQREEEPKQLVIQRAGVIFPAHISRFVHILSEVTDMPQRDARGGGAGA